MYNKNKKQFSTGLIEMDITPSELSSINSYFIEISLLYHTYPEKYQGFYLIFVDNIVDSYSSDIKEEIYDTYKRFRSKYKLQCPSEMSEQLANIIYSIILN
jgi:hypothetical protein